jgi:hypothetical protein
LKAYRLLNHSPTRRCTDEQGKWSKKPEKPISPGLTYIEALASLEYMAKKKAAAKSKVSKGKKGKKA